MDTHASPPRPAPAITDMAAGAHALGRIPVLDGIRGIAILAVIGYHADVLFGGQYGAGWSLLPARLLGAGWLGVQLFFVLSGFLITTLLLGRRQERLGRFLGGFYGRRTVRILPLYYGFLILYLLVLKQVPPFNGLPAVGAAGTTSLFAFYYNFRAPTQGIPVLHMYWSLCVEEQFYLVWPLLVWLLNDRALRCLCLGLVAGAAALRILAIARPHGLAIAYLTTPCVLDAPAAGALVALLRRDAVAWPWVRRWAGTVAIAAALAVLAIAVSQGHFYDNLDARYGALPVHNDSHVVQTWGVSAAVLLFGALIAGTIDPGTRGMRGLTRVLSHPALRSVGFYSYAMYVFHRVVLHVLSYLGRTFVPGFDTFPPLAAKPLMIALIVATAYGLARVSYVAWERPFLRLGSRHRKSNPAPVTQVPAG